MIENGSAVSWEHQSAGVVKKYSGKVISYIETNESAEAAFGKTGIDAKKSQKAFSDLSIYKRYLVEIEGEKTVYVAPLANVIYRFNEPLATLSKLKIEQEEISRKINEAKLVLKKAEVSKKQEMYKKTFEKLAAIISEAKIDVNDAITYLKSIATGCSEKPAKVGRRPYNKKSGNDTSLTVNGVTRSITEWSQITGIKYSKIYSRLHQMKWEHEACVTP